MSKLLRALVKARAVRVEADGVLVPTHNRVPKETAAVFGDGQLLLADQDGVTVFNSGGAYVNRAPVNLCVLGKGCIRHLAVPARITSTALVLTGGVLLSGLVGRAVDDSTSEENENG